MLELTAPRTMSIAEREIPTPGIGEVVVAVSALGICGTDLHLFDGRGDRYPWVVGHDAAGVVHAIGKDVTGLEVGQRVAVDPVLACGVCKACRAGRSQLCQVGGYMGMLGPGMAAEFVALPARQIVSLPDSVSDLAATALEPIAVALHTLRRVAPLMPEAGKAIVIGGGPLGLLQAQVMEHFGWRCVVIEPQQYRRRIGSGLGLQMLDPTEAASSEDLMSDDTTPRLVVETSAAAAGVDLADHFAKPGSVVAVIGRGPHSISPPSVLLKELSIIGVKGGPGQYGPSADLVVSGIVDPTAIITHTYSWDESATAFADTSSAPDSILRTAVHGSW